MHISQPKVSALEAVCPSRVIDAEAMQQRGIQVVDVNRIASDVEAVVVRFCIGDSGTNASSGEPHREAATVMVAAVVVGGRLSLW